MNQIETVEVSFPKVCFRYQLHFDLCIEFMHVSYLAPVYYLNIGRIGHLYYSLITLPEFDHIEEVDSERKRFFAQSFL